MKRDFIFPPRLKQIDQNDLGSVIYSTLVYFTHLYLARDIFHHIENREGKRHHINFTLSKVLMQGKLIAVAYTLRTY